MCKLMSQSNLPKKLMMKFNTYFKMKLLLKKLQFHLNPYRYKRNIQKNLRIKEELRQEAFLKEAADKEYILFLEHDFESECCTLENTEKGVRLKEKGQLADFFGK